MKEENQKNNRILVIDDSESIHKDFRAILENSETYSSDLSEAKFAIFGNTSELPKQISFEIDSAFQGEEGLEKVQQALRDKRPYAMAFVDVRMPPGWDGIKTIKKIWKEYPELQVVICTAYSDYEWKDIITQLGQTDQLLILKKPFDNIEVYQLANSLTEKWHFAKLAQLKRNDLEAMVRERTAQLKQANEKLSVALEEAKMADTAKSEFLANMSHEIRTPLNSIIGFSDLLADETIAEEHKHYVHAICDSAKHLLGIINNILDFSKIEAGKLDVQMSECSLKSLLTKVESITKPLAVRKSLKFEIIENKNLPLNICTDVTRLDQCLINLISNAIKFTEEGCVSMEVSLENKCNQPYIRFDVCDTGVGIPVDKQDKIFESFTQADGSTSRKYGGTGLGLTITRQLVELLGGELTLTSNEGEGSVFSIMIPALVDLTTHTLLDKDKVIDHINDEYDKLREIKFSGHILVAEDVKSNQTLIRHMLEKAGFDVTIAEDGNEAIQMVMNRPVDLIFMDLQMPNMNGYEATKKLRKKGVKTPIIALTASAMPGDEFKCINSGFDDYMSKPIDRCKLLNMLHKYLVGSNESLSEKASFVKSQTVECKEICGDRKPQESSLAKTEGDEECKQIFSWNCLISKLGDEDLISVIVPIFLKENKERLDKLAKAVKEGDAIAIKFHAHAVKGAGRNIGAESLSNVACRLESADTEKDLESVKKLFDKLKLEFEKIVTFFSHENWLNIAKQEGVITNEKLESIYN